MTDISMCAHNNCPLSVSCYRHEDSGTKPSTWRQSYIMGDGTSDCPNFWERTLQVAVEGTMS